ncbi:MAG TPA: biotin/lipoyl-containing protein [Anaerolineales bacterium]|nr:biotin/lipoyl-containing protein [Anaerolineales bacterium]
MNYRFCFDGAIHSVDLEKTSEGYLAAVNGKTFLTGADRIADGELHIHLDGRPLYFFWASDGPQRWVWLDGRTYLLDTRTALAKGGAGSQLADRTLRAPMPGQVIEVPVAAGEVVTKGQTLVLLEAMKMEIRIQAPREGEVGRVLVEAGETVEREQALVELIFDLK